MVNHRYEEHQPLMTESQRRANGDEEAVVDAAHPDAPLSHGSSSSATANDSGTSTPRFLLQDQNPSKRFRWVPYPLRRIATSIARWAQGPENAQPYRITPFFRQYQEFPLVLTNRLLPTKTRRYAAAFLYFSVWIIAFVLVKRRGELSTEIAAWGQPQTISCGDTWFGKGNACGVDGNDCRPFNDTGFPFRCPANCESYHVLNPRAVGTQEIIYRSFVIGGPPKGGDTDDAIYRGDSFICGAAIHAGVITNGRGGCGVVELIGEQQSYVSSARNDIVSVGFDSYFPQSFRFIPDINCKAEDSRWSLLAISAVFTGVLALITSSPAFFFFPTFIGIFWTTGMALDPPTHSRVTALFATVIGRFLPAMFIAWVMFDKMGVRRTLYRLTAGVEKAILWLGACWVGAMDNYTLSFIPIQRLTGHDLQQQPGAKAALAMIIIVLTVIVVFQIYFFRQEGRFLKYIRLYALLVFGLLVSLTLPGLNLRIHHYIIALLLLPGTSLQTRPSLVFQGLLIGLFINGIARWGFDPILQTSEALRGDATRGTPLPILVDIIPQGSNNITFSWERRDARSVDGISILVNDIERYRSFFDDDEYEFTWVRDEDHEGMDEYFRFAYMLGRETGDYTKAGTWTGDGEWVKMASGPSRL